MILAILFLALLVLAFLFPGIVLVPIAILANLPPFFWFVFFVVLVGGLISRVARRT